MHSKAISRPVTNINLLATINHWESLPVPKLILGLNFKAEGLAYMYITVRRRSLTSCLKMPVHDKNSTSQIPNSLSSLYTQNILD